MNRPFESDRESSAGAEICTAQVSRLLTWIRLPVQWDVRGASPGMGVISAHDRARERRERLGFPANRSTMTSVAAHTRAWTARLKLCACAPAHDRPGRRVNLARV